MAEFPTYAKMAKVVAEKALDEYLYEGKTIREWIKIIVEQEPNTVLYSGDGYADGYMVYDMAECPNCGYKYEEGDKDWKEPFCPHCGQALKWESEGRYGKNVRKLF